MQHRCSALDADIERVASSQNISISIWSDTDTKRLSVDPAQPVHEAIAEAFGVNKTYIQRIVFGDIDVVEGESFVDHGVEVGYSLWRSL